MKTTKKFAIILSGGIGTRMSNLSVPKQYVEVYGKPIIIRTLEQFQKAETIDKIVIVAADYWRPIISDWVQLYSINKVVDFACPGSSRQESIFNGLKICMNYSNDAKDIVVIHDAVRPLVSVDLINSCVDNICGFDGCLPVIPLNDTVYLSDNGEEIKDIINRNLLYAGQSPESFYLHKYFDINNVLSKQEMEQITGSSMIAYKNGLKVRLIKGDPRNYKITTNSDLERYSAIEEKNDESV